MPEIMKLNVYQISLKAEIKTVIDAISNVGRGIPGARVLGIEPDVDYNRTVLTIAGEPEAVSEAAFRG